MTAAAQEAHQWLDLQYEASLLPPFYEGGHWTLPTAPGLMVGMQSSFADPNHYPLDGRGTTYAMAFFCPKHSGLGSYYLMATRDNQGRPFDGGRTYRLHVPPNVPVQQYWSATVYDRATHGLVRGMTRASRSSQSPGLQIKLFWSVTVYDADTRALILNEQKIADRSSRMDLRKNDDGSVDIFLRAEGAVRLREKLDPDGSREKLVRVLPILPAD